MHLTNYSLNKHSKNFVKNVRASSHAPPPVGKPVGQPGQPATARGLACGRPCD